MRVGYSFWGFLGAGITDTPDGGRSHRRTLVDGIAGLGHTLVFLQANRDLLEADDDLGGQYVFDRGLPNIDLLFVEWRWPIPGRNTTPCDKPGHTCDLHRQAELLYHYTRDRRTPTIVWDKDLQLPVDHWLRKVPHVTLCEAALHPGPGAVRLLFPVDDHALDAADPVALASLPRDLPLVYVGNQYDRDEPFDRYFAPVAATVLHQVAGKWTATDRWPQVNFTDRIPFPEVEPLHQRALATMLLAPDRLAARGQFTQRIFEAVLAGCAPIAPAYLRAVDHVVPRELIAQDAEHAREILRHLSKIAGSPRHADLISRCLHHLTLFRLSNQLIVLSGLLDDARTAQATRC
ncbi:hypothetical protein [Actinomadura sp. SCN-SB]|uniref:hypothetical protein n=1 Tax=Actinomadura sp. SCN-SB TaxID=3373092 RepID=UPI0037523DCC